jgi:hypothetical protein
VGEVATVISKRMVVPLFSGVLLAFSCIFLYWLMGVCKSVVLICIPSLLLGRIMLFIRCDNWRCWFPVFVVVGVVRVPA